MFGLTTILKQSGYSKILQIRSVLVSIMSFIFIMNLSAQSNERYSASTRQLQQNHSTTKSFSIKIVGFVKNVQQMTPWNGATVFLYDKQNHKIYVTKTDSEGQYIFHVNAPFHGIIKAMDHNTYNDCMAIEVKTSPLDSIQLVDRDLFLEKVPIGKDWRFQNIYYDSGKWEPRPEAYPILDSIAKVMNLYPVNIKISSHTDGLGSEEYNEKLSQLRAETVAKYLINKGIESDRIIAKGYGSRFLLFVPKNGIPCTNAENQENRRTEFKILGFISFEKQIEPFDPNQWHKGEVIPVPSDLAQQINFSPCTSEPTIEITSQKKEVAEHETSLPSFNKDSVEILPFQGAVIQLGAFKNKKYALALYQKAIEKTGKHTLILIENQFYKVRLNGFHSEKEARLYVNQLNKLGFTATYIPILPADFSIKISSLSHEASALKAQKEIEKQTKHTVSIEYDPPYFYLLINDLKTKEAAESVIQSLIVPIQ